MVSDWKKQLEDNKNNLNQDPAFEPIPEENQEEIHL
jgi:hypothetical protein